MRKVSAYLMNNNRGDDLLENVETHIKIDATNHEIDSLIVTKKIEISGVLRKRGRERESHEG